MTVLSPPGRGWLLALLVLMAGPALAQSFPKLTGRVVDAAHVLPPATVADLDSKSAALEARSGGTQLVVATVPDLQGLEIEEYGYKLGRAWGIGQTKTNTGVILLVAPNQRKVRIEVGYGLEPVLTDALGSSIVRNRIIPRFKAGDFPGGITAGADAIIAQLGAAPDQAQAANAQARAEQAQLASGARAAEGGGRLPPIALIILLLFLLWIFVFRRRGRRWAGGGPVILWGPGGGWGGDGWSGGGWSGGGWGEGGSGGGGGFSGGGGSFGGGGASGGW